jgi:glycosyltransferase involved in cell wall biosynthesis
MKIAIDARPTQGSFTGDATYWRGFINGLIQLDSPDEYHLYYLSRLKQPERIDKSNIHQSIKYAPNWRMWTLFTFPSAIRFDKIDLTHVQYSLPPFVSGKIITSIHDVSFKRHPEFFSKKDAFILDMGVKRACRRADRILAISEYTKSEICSLYTVDEKLVDIVYPGIDDIFYPRSKSESKSMMELKYGVNDPFILSLGVIQPRKNLPRLLEGYALSKNETGIKHKLVIAGKYGWMAEDISAKTAELNISEDVVFTGYAPYEELPYLYSAADLFVYPSVYEGFGLPPAESMACGTPVITGNKTSLPEVIGDAGLMVDPLRSEEFADAITKVLNDSALYDKLSEAGIKQANKFTWLDMAKQVNSIYHEIIP